MCGIFGITIKTLNLKQIVASGAALLCHRGPDNEGSWQNDHVKLEHSRLAIIDLSDSANQPFEIVKGKVLVFNGEIYNFQKLREIWSNDEIPWKTNSDTEVLYKGLIKEGVNCLKKLNGMFAFGFYDSESNKILIVRDRYGIKPVYYYHDESHFIFASEQKAIAKFTGWNPNLSNLSEYAVFKYTSGNKTMIEKICELEPGHAAEFDVNKGKLRIWRWYDFVEQRTEEKIDYEKLDNIIFQAVKIHLISDVPLGIQLSGGIDSSILAWYVSKIRKDNVKSFSITLPDSKFDESKEASETAKKFNFEHYEIPFTIKDFIEIWPKAIKFFDEPINHPHTLALFKLYQVAKNHVKVLLSGEGADEVFLGYEHHKKSLNIDNFEELRDFDKFLDYDIIKKFLNLDFVKNIEDYWGNKTNDAKFWISKGISGISGFEFHHHLNTLLNRVDKMSMAHSVEVRVPFLDYKLAEFGLRQNKNNLFKISNNKVERKIPLMVMFEKLFGKSLQTEKKIGFRIPFDEWLQAKDELRKFCAEILLKSNKIKELNNIEIEKLEKILSSNNKLDENQIRITWVLTNYIMWRISL
jgi:asparagine synthase (glutamine-hydrolysing)